MRMRFGFAVVAGMGITAAAIACGAPPDEPREDEGDRNLGVARSAFTPSTCTGVDSQIRAAALKYNLPRWFLYAMAMRESSCNATVVNTHGGTTDVGYGLMQLTHDWYTGYPLPYGFSDPDAGQQYGDWKTYMGITNYCTGFPGQGLPCPWIDMHDITTLASGTGAGSYADAAANLDRFCSGFAAPAFHLFKKKNPGDSAETTLRRVAWHWRYGINGDANYPSDSGQYLSLSDGSPGTTTYDAYINSYKGPVEAEDGVWAGPPATPPYGGASSSWTASVTGITPSGGSATVGCVNYAKATAATISGTFQDTGAPTSGYPDIEVWNGANVGSGHPASPTSFTTNSSTSYAYTWNVGANGAGSYEIKLGVLNPSTMNPYSGAYFANKGTIEVIKPGDGAKQDFECGNKYGWLSSGGILGTPTSGKTGGGYAGSYSLVVPVTGTASGANHVYTQTAPLPAAGNTVTFHVYVPSGSSIYVIQPYVKDTSFTFTGAWRDAGTGLVTGWNTVSLTVPSNAASMLEMGVEFRTNASWSGNAYVDAVTW